MEEVGLPQTCMRGHRPKERMSAVMGESGELLQFSTQRPFQTLASPLATRKVYLARATVPLLTQVALKTFTTEAIWLIVQAMLSLSIGPSLEALTLMENIAVANTTERIFLCLSDLVYILSTVFLAKSAKPRRNDRMTKKTREMTSLSSLLRSGHMKQEEADLCQEASHISMPACQQVFLGGAAYTAARSGMDSNCTMAAMAREKGMTLQNQNTVCVTEVAM